MNPTRYVFTGNCSGVAFHIRRPVDAVLPVQAASSLPVTGGRSESTAGSGKLDNPNSSIPYVTFKSASTSAVGDYIDAGTAVRATRGDTESKDVATSTDVSSEVTGLVVMGRVEVDRAVMKMQAQSAKSGEQPTIRCDGVVLEGVRFDGYKLKITLAEEFFCYNDTFNKLGAVCNTGVNPQLFLASNLAASYGFGPAGMVKCTLVDKMEWDGDPHPSAKIEGHAVVVPDLGTVYFGESFITADSRRITMVRFELGTPNSAANAGDGDDSDRGDGSAASGDTNGSPWPPDFP